MTNTKLQCIWRDGCNQFDACQAAERCQGLRSNREKAEQAPSKEQVETHRHIAASLRSIADNIEPHEFPDSAELLRRYARILDDGPSHEPRADGCEVCAKPLPPVGAWSMPSCPDCQEVLGFLGELQADFAERDRTQKAEMVGNAIRLICSRTAPPPASALSDQERHALWNAVEAARSGFAWTDPTGRKLLTELYERSALTKEAG